MIGYRLFYPNGGSAGGGGDSMGVSTPSGTLYDPSWADGYNNWASGNSGWNSGFGSNNNSSRNGESGFYNSLSGENIGSLSSSLNPKTDYKIGNHNNEFPTAYGEQFSTIDFGLEGKVPLVGGLYLTLSQSANSDYPVLGISWNVLSVNHEGVTFTTPGVGFSVTMGFQYTGLIIMGFNYGPGYISFSFDVKKVMDGLEEWNSEATARIYNGYNVGGSGFNMSQLP